jgi:hypothetical protein
MTFELVGKGGVHFSCSSPRTAKILLEKGARLLNEEQAEYLRLALDAAPPDQQFLATGPRPLRPPEQ